MIAKFLTVLLIFDGLCLHFGLEEETYVGRNRIRHEAYKIPDERISSVSRLSDIGHLRKAVKNILIPRVVGTPGHDKVRDYISESLKGLNFHVELDSFYDDTPIFGRLKFENIIATLNPYAERYLILACHYDSKYMADHEFLGATDSAVPCAMLLNIAHVLKKHLDTVKTRQDLSLMLLFFDGEEAFDQWGPKDSIYGARHLAAKWNAENFIDKIDMLVLLDLIGAPDPKFYSYFKSTESWYARMVVAEERLASEGFLDNYTTSSVVRHEPKRYLQTRSANSFVEDDHVPFMNLGVPILHLIPVPFPEVWHTKEDDHDVIDYTTVENINKILRIFTLEFLRIDTVKE